MRYLSLFSGIEAATAAWHTLGWECVGVSEIEPFPCAVLAHHYPDVPNLGDVTKIEETDIMMLGPIDVVVFGSPCQDLSVAGKRKGFDGERSSLFFTAMRIVKWAREHCGCRFALWENVPGAFSSNKGRDFAAVVEHMAGLAVDVPPKGWGTEGCAVGEEGMVEWAVLDAQWFGVAQRRRRVFAIADFGDWPNRPPILLEPESLRGDSAPRRETWEEVAGSLASRTEGGGFPGTDEACGGYIRPVVTNSGDVSFCLTRGAQQRFDTETETETVIVHPVFAIQAGALRENPASGPDGVGVQEGAAYTLEARAEVQAVAVSLRGREGGGTAELGDEVQNCLRASGGGGDKPHVLAPVAFNWNAQPDQMNFDPHTTAALTCSQGAAFGPTPAMRVRRLTPRECERLQGFLDDYTRIPWKAHQARAKRKGTSASGESFEDFLISITGRGLRQPTTEDCPDGPRYKALGNSMCTNVMRWIGQRIDAAVAVEWLLS